MQQVIFDSSFLMALAERPTTWFEDMVEALGRFEPVLPSCVRGELERLAAGEGKKARSARVALELSSKFAAERCGGASVDDEVVSAALTSGGMAATTDSQLLRSLKSAGVRVVTLRQGRVSLD